MVSLNIRKFLIVLLVLSIHVILAAASADKIGVIIDHYDSIDSYRAQFHQTNYWLELDKSFTSRGIIYLKKEKMLLKYEEPEGQLLKVDKTGILIYDPARKQAVYSDSDGFDINPKSLLEKYRERALVSVNDIGQTVIKVELDNEETYQFIVIENMIERIVYTGNNGDYVQYDLLNPVVNGSFDAEIFEITLPRDVSIIDNRTNKE